MGTAMTGRPAKRTMAAALVYQSGPILTGRALPGGQLEAVENLGSDNGYPQDE